MNKKYLYILTVIILLSFTGLNLSSAAGYTYNLIRYAARQKNKIPSRYTSPTDSQIAILRSAVSHILNSQFSSATIEANAIGYTVKTFTDKVNTDNLIFYILESKEPRHRPWGTYIFYLGGGSTVDTVIEVPHPVSERNTTEIGIKLLIKVLNGDNKSTNKTKTYVFLLSGSRRSKCDVSYESPTVFQAVHEEATSSSTDVVQIHGFNIYKYPQIIVTCGTPVTSSTLDRYVMEFIQAFDLGIYDGVQYIKLGSTGNLQAQYTNSIGGNFIGIFLNRAVHHSKRLSSSFINLTETAISETTTTETSAN